MKALFLDDVTTQILSCVYTQSEILGREVYLVCRIDDGPSSSRKSPNDHSLSLYEEEMGGDVEVGGGGGEWNAVVVQVVVVAHEGGMLPPSDIDERRASRA